MRSFWKLCVSTATEEEALRVFEAVRGKLGGEVRNAHAEPYPKTSGFLIRFEIDLGDVAWNDGVVEVIAAAQRIGRAWVLAGDVREDPSGWSDEPSVPGVRVIEWSLTAPPDRDVPRP